MHSKTEIESPLVSVIMPAYNHERFVRAAIESVWDQTYRNTELIVLDDGSTDGTAAVIQSMAAHSPIRMQFVRQENRGVTRTLNRGLALASGKYVGFLASDDTLYPTKHQVQVEWLETHVMNGYAGCFANGLEMFADGSIGRRISEVWSLDRGFTLDNVLAHRVSWLGHSGLFLRDAVQRIGGFDEALRYEDFDFVARFITHHRLCYINDVLCCYRVGHGGNLSDKAELMAEDYPEVIRKMLKSGAISEKAANYYLSRTFLKIGGRFYARRRMSEARLYLLKSMGYQLNWPAIKLFGRSLAGSELAERISQFRSKQAVKEKAKSSDQG